MAAAGAACDWERERRELELGLHSAWRGKLNRLMRRTKGYAKSLEMLTYSLALVCRRQGQKSNDPSY